MVLGRVAEQPSPNYQSKWGLLIPLRV